MLLCVQLLRLPLFFFFFDHWREKMNTKGATPHAWEELHQLGKSEESLGGQAFRLHPVVNEERKLQGSNIAPR